MNKSDALKLRDEYRTKLVGKPFGKKQNGWDIKDVIISSPRNVGKLYQAMYEKHLTNEQALALFKSDDFKVYVISHQWPWGSGDVYTESIESYIKNNPI